MSDMVRPKGMKFLSATKDLVFEVAIKYGQGLRRLDVIFPAEEIIKLGDRLKAHNRENWGHAFWHYQHDLPIPCSSCVLVGKKVVQCKEGNCDVHKTRENEICFKVVDAQEGR